MWLQGQVLRLICLMFHHRFCLQQYACQSLQLCLILAKYYKLDCSLSGLCLWHSPSKNTEWAYHAQVLQWWEEGGVTLSLEWVT